MYKIYYQIFRGKSSTDLDDEMFFFLEKTEKCKNAKSKFCRFQSSAASTWKKMKFEKCKNQNLRISTALLRILISFFEKWKILKNEKWTQRRYHLQFATKFSPQKVFDIKIRTPACDSGKYEWWKCSFRFCWCLWYRIFCHRGKSSKLRRCR